MSRHHAAFRNNPRWKQAREDCLDRDGRACVWCGTAEEDLEQPLEADHILEANSHPELALEVENLRTLCKPCHIERGRQSSAGVGISRNPWVNPKYADILAPIL